MGKLDGKIALITGGSSGIGFATAQQFIDEGIEHVFITGPHQQTLDEAIKIINKTNISGIQGDISNMDDLDKLYNIIKKEKGYLDIIFANAGILVDGLIGSITEKDFDNAFNINVKGLLFSVQKVLPILVNGGSIILNSSVRSCKASSNRSVYSSTKAAIRSFARSWSVDLKDRQIRVNAISPGPIDISISKINDNNNNNHSKEEKNILLGNLATQTVMNRRGTPKEVAQAVVFLASNDSSYITGIELFVDGGFAQI